MSVVYACISVTDMHQLLHRDACVALEKTQERKIVSPNHVFHFALLYFLTTEKKAHKPLKKQQQAVIFFKVYKLSA